MAQRDRASTSSFKGEGMIRRFLAFVKDVRVEMEKVSWSSRPELVSSTWVVLISSALLAAVIGVFDVVCTTLVHVMLR